MDHALSSRIMHGPSIKPFGIFGKIVGNDGPHTVPSHWVLLLKIPKIDDRDKKNGYRVPGNCGPYIDSLVVVDPMPSHREL